ncbi:MAG: ABC transporter substrate-binding protein, partial [Microbacteriaceae bacterium]
MKEITRKGPKAITTKRFTVLASLVLASLLVSGCAAETPTATDDHVLRIGTTTEVTNWTPLNSFSTSDYWVLGELYPELFLLSPEGELLPHLLTDFEVSQDGKLVTLHLDERFRWSDGEPITASDIAFTLERFVSDKLLSGSSVAWNYQESIIISPTEIKVVAKKPSFGWALDLVQSISILPEHVFAGVDDLSKYSLEQHP